MVEDWLAACVNRLLRRSKTKPMGCCASFQDGLQEAKDGAPRLILVAAGSADALRFDYANVLREGYEAPLTANGKHVGLYWAKPRNAWGHWDYIDLGVSEKLRPLSVKLDGPYLIWNGPHGEFAFDVSMWQLHEGRHLVAVKACAGNPGGPTRMSKDAAGRFRPTRRRHDRAAAGSAFAARRLRSETPAPCGPGWSAHQNIDMCGQGDVEIIHNWRATHSIEDLQRIVEQKGYCLHRLRQGSRRPRGSEKVPVPAHRWPLQAVSRVYEHVVHLGRWRVG